MPDNIYHKQAEMLLRILPSVMREEVFTLKGGTAINFFWRNYQQLSVDINLAYVKIQDRDSTLKEINDRLLKTDNMIKRIYPDAYIQQKKESNLIYALIVRVKDATVKIEVNFNMRGSVYESVKKKLCYKAEKEFELSLSVTTLSFEDLYGGKICAALDRQHPRDLFDIKLLFDNEGLTDKIRKAFIVYLISHGRPMIELLNPSLKDIKADFENDFAGMTAEPVNLDDLINTRLELIKRIKESLTKDEVKFILSVENKEPEWGLLELEGIGNLPGVKYKLMNLNKMEPKKHKLAYEKLKKYLMA
jgi:predicted nucleotidyltransferase component of viral defense system